MAAMEVSSEECVCWESEEIREIRGRESAGKAGSGGD